MENNRILGVDPGSRYTGWGVIEQQGSQIKRVASGRIEAYKAGALAERLVCIFDGLEQVIQAYCPGDSAVEQIFVSVNGKTTLILGQARGVALLCMAKVGLTISEYSANQVKSAVVGQGKASKEQVQSMVQVILGLKGVAMSEDESDALAVAICHSNSRHFSRLSSQVRAQ